MTHHAPTTLTVLGGTGATGRHLIDQTRGSTTRLKVLGRRADALPREPHVTPIAGDVTDPEAVDAAVVGADAVISVVGVRFTSDPVTTYTAGLATTLEAMRRHEVRRLVAVTSATADPDWRPTGEWFFNHVIDPLVNRRLGRQVHEDIVRMEAAIRASDVEWTMVRPSGLFDAVGPTVREVRPERADGIFTARQDLASTLLEEAGGHEHIGVPVAVITTAPRPSIAGLIWREMRSG